MHINHLWTESRPNNISTHMIEVDGLPTIVEARGLALRLISELNRREEKIGVAESCTGGLIGSLITDIPGSSSVFEIGVVSYSNDAKHRLLGVSRHILTTRGAVSGECVLSMANGVRLLSKAEYGVAVSGIAGPGGATEHKPVGTVFFGFSSVDTNVYTEIKFRLERIDTKLASACVALSLASHMIKEI